jgi:ABC-type uncharacterized transport system involved in gliding motility auxiliary subunit
MGSKDGLGVISLVLLFFGTTAYFIAGPGFFVLLNLAFGTFAAVASLASARETIGTFLGERSTRYGANAAIYSLFFVGIVMMANFLASRHFHRFDVTENQVFSLASQSVNAVKDLAQDLEMIGFVEGGSDPGLGELFKSYASASNRVKTQVVDPDKNPELAQRYKITNYGTVRVAYGEQSTLVSKLDEESITNAILKVTHETKKTVCVVEGHGEPDMNDAQGPKGYGALKSALEADNYTVQALLLATQEKVPDTCNLLVVASGSKPLLEPEIGVLKSYLKGGGRAVFLLGAQKGADLVPIVADYGIKVGNDVVVDQVVRLFQGPALGLDPIASNYGQHPITAGFTQRTMFPLTRSVDAAGAAKPGIEVVSLVKTSQSSWAESDLDSLFQKSAAALDPTKDQKGPVSIAVAAKADVKQLGGDKEGEARLVVFGSAGFPDNKNINNFFNRDLILNAVGWTVGEEKSISIRARNVRASRVQLTSDQVSRIFYLSVLIVPELLLLVGISVWNRRRGA